MLTIQHVRIRENIFFYVHNITILFTTSTTRWLLLLRFCCYCCCFFMIVSCARSYVCCFLHVVCHIVSLFFSIENKRKPKTIKHSKSSELKREEREHISAYFVVFIFFCFLIVFVCLLSQWFFKWFFKCMICFFCAFLSRFRIQTPKNKHRSEWIERSEKNTKSWFPPPLSSLATPSTHRNSEKLLQR